MRRIRRALTTFLHRIGTTAILLVLSLAAGWRPVVRTGIRWDLHRIAQAVRASTIPLADKERLLDRIDQLNDRLKAGEQLDLESWVESQDAIKAMLDGGISFEESRLIGRELRRVEFVEEEHK